MIESTKAFLDGLVLPVILAMFGGVARACRFGVKSWRQFCSNIVVSAFTGVVVHLLIVDTEMSQSMQAAIVAASGYSGGVILDALVAVAVQHVGSKGPQAGK